jgi:hypothetical protein
MAKIARDVRLDLGRPVGRIVPSRKAAHARGQIAAVPEVAIAEDGHTLPAEDDVRPSRQVSPVQPKPSTQTPQGPTEQELAARPRLLA